MYTMSPGSPLFPFDPLSPFSPTTPIVPYKCNNKIAIDLIYVHLVQEVQCYPYVLYLQDLLYYLFLQSYHCLQEFL